MHWAIVLLVVMLLFGSRRLPDTARGLARSLRIFKSEMGDADQPAHPQPSAQPTGQPSAQSAVPAVAPATQGDLNSWPKPEYPAAIPAPAPVSTTATAASTATTAHAAPQPTMIAPRPEVSGAAGE